MEKSTFRATTYGFTYAPDGTWTAQVSPGLWSVAVDPADPDFPRYLTLSTSNILQQFECVEDACEAVPVGFRPAVRSA